MDQLPASQLHICRVTEYEDEPVFKDQEVSLELHTRYATEESYTDASIEARDLKVFLDDRECEPSAFHCTDGTISFTIPKSGCSGEKAIRVCLRDTETSTSVKFIGAENFDESRCSLLRRNCKTVASPNCKTCYLANSEARNVTKRSRWSYLVRCVDCEAAFIVGPDHSRINNISRVLGMEIENSDIVRVGRGGRGRDDSGIRHNAGQVWSCENCDCACCYNRNLDNPEVYSSQVMDVRQIPVDRRGKCVDVDLHRLWHLEEARKVHGLLASLFGGHHFRGLAIEFDKRREEWKKRATLKYNEGDKDMAKKCSNIKEKYGKLMDECNRKACDAIFSFYNEGRHQSEIDLHELYAGDDRKLKAYRSQLLRKNSETEVTQIIDQTREENEEAIRKLRERLETLDREASNNDGKPWLEVIVGAGHHSRDHRQKIRPKVETFLREREGLPAFQELNKGALLITFQEYSGKEPCFGHYYCKKCQKSWCNDNSWVNRYQCCYRCYEKSGHTKMEKCFPMRQERFRSSPGRTGHRPSFGAIPSHREMQNLCQKCCELKEYCGYPRFDTTR